MKVRTKDWTAMADSESSSKVLRTSREMETTLTSSERISVETTIAKSNVARRMALREVRGLKKKR